MGEISEYFEQAQLSFASYAEGLERGMFGADDAEYVNKPVGWAEGRSPTPNAK